MLNLNEVVLRTVLVLGHVEVRRAERRVGRARPGAGEGGGQVRWGGVQQRVIRHGGGEGVGVGAMARGVVMEVDLGMLKIRGWRWWWWN